MLRFCTNSFPLGRGGGGCGGQRGNIRFCWVEQIAFASSYTNSSQSGRPRLSWCVISVDIRSRTKSAENEIDGSLQSQYGWRLKEGFVVCAKYRPANSKFVCTCFLKVNTLLFPELFIDMRIPVFEAQRVEFLSLLSKIFIVIISTETHKNINKGLFLFLSFSARHAQNICYLYLYLF